LSSLELSGGIAAPSRQLWLRVTAVCWFLVLLDGLDLFVYGASLPGVLKDKSFGLTPAMAGDIGSFNTFGMLLGALAAGVITDRLGRRKIILAGVAVFTLSAAACGMTPDVTAFGIARFTAGVGLGVLLPTTIAMVMEFAPPARKNIAVTFLMTAHQAGGAIAGAVAMNVVESLGWRSVYWFGAAPIIIAVPAILFLLPESLTYLQAAGRTEEARAIVARYGVSLAAYAPERGADKRRGKVSELFTPALRTTTLLFWAASFGGLLLVYGVNTWLPQMMRSHGYNLGSAISFLLVINLGGIVGMLVAGRLADRFGPRRVTVIWFLVTCLGIGLLVMHMPLWVTYVDVFLTGGFLFSAQTLIYASVGTYYLPSVRATSLGWVSGMGRFGAVFGPWLGGVLVAHQISNLGFGVFAAAALMSAVLVALVRAKPVGAIASASVEPSDTPATAAQPT